MVVGAGAIIGIAPFRDNSFFTHLATGRLILEEGFPRADPYSFTAAGEPWVVQSWLVSVVIALVEDLGGLAGVRVLFGVLTALLAGVVWLLTAPARGLLVRLALAGVVVVMGAAGSWPERPLLVGLLGVGALLLACEGRFDPRWCVPILWIWANSHGSFPLGLVLVGLLWVGARLDGHDGRTERRVLLWAALGAALGVVGPLGLRVLLFPVELLARQDALAGVKEWEAPGFREVAERAFLVLLLVAVVALVRRPSWRSALPVVVFLGLALTSARNLAPLALVLVPVVARGFADVGQLRGERSSPPVRIGAALVAFVVLLVLTVPLRQGAPAADDVAAQLEGRPHLGLGGYPVAALTWLDERGVLAGEHRLIAREIVGNYQVMVFGTEANVFMDDRFDMYPTTVLDDHDQLLKGDGTERGGPLAVLDRNDADYVVWRASEPLAQLLAASDEWAVAYVDDGQVVACRRGAACERLVIA